MYPAMDFNCKKYIIEILNMNSDYEELVYCDKDCDNCKRRLGKKERRIVEEEIVEILLGCRIDHIESCFYDILYHITDEQMLLAFHNMLIPIDEFSDKIKTIRKKVYYKESQ